MPNLVLFEEAAKIGINRTVHAGENGTHLNVLEVCTYSLNHLPFLLTYNFPIKALDDMQCNRLGHGYHALDCKNVYGRILSGHMHLEMCPISSIITGSVTSDFEEHALQR